MYETTSLNDPRFILFQKKRELSKDDYIKFLEDRVVFLETELERFNKVESQRAKFDSECG
jgi:hypothetical protein